MKVIIAYDGSVGADHAVRELNRAGLPIHVEALVVSVAEPWPDAAVIHDEKGTLQTPLWNQRDATALAGEAAAMLREQFPGWQVATAGFEGGVTRSIVRRSEEWGADLVVVGPHGRGRPTHDCFGSISQQVVTGAHCSVRIARYNPENLDEPVRLVIATDGSADAGVAVDSVLHREWPEHTTLMVVSGTVGDDNPDAAAEAYDRYSTLHEQIERRARAAGLGFHSVIEQSDPKQLILDAAEEYRADCIFVGCRGLTRFERTLVGSVSASVAARGRCSVEVARRRR